MTERYDVIIIGGGGSGLTAAIYAARANLKTVVFERMTPGGQIFLTDMVENYPGFPEGVTGPDISDRMLDQAKKNGAELRYEEVSSVSQDDLSKVLTVKTSAGEYEAKALILTNGAQFRTLNIPGEKELTGKGVSYCATCDAAFFKDKEVVVIGGGDSALQEGIFLTRFAKQVSIVHRRDKLRAGATLESRAKKNPKIQFIWNTIPKAVNGEGKVESVILQDVNTKEEINKPTDGLFIFVGHGPSSSIYKDFIELDEHGYVASDSSYQTSRAGVFAAGEIRGGSVRQLVAACGEGCGAALEAQHYLENLE